MAPEPIDPSSDPCKDVRDHGMSLEPGDTIVQCCYCGKHVSGFEHLQQHLGGIRGSTLECPNVHEDVKEFFRNHLLPSEVGPLVNEVGDLDQPSPSKRRCTSNGNLNRHELSSTSNGRSAVIEACSNREGLSPASLARERRCNSSGNLNGDELCLITSNGGSALLKACSNKEGLHSASIASERRRTSNSNLNGHKLGSISNGRSPVLKACSNKKGLNCASIASERRCTSNGNLNGHKLGSASNGRSAVLKACSNKEGLNSASIASERRCTSKANLNGHELGSASNGRSAVLEACSNKEGLNFASIARERRCTSNGNLNGNELGSASNGRSAVLEACSNKEGLNFASIARERRCTSNGNLNGNELGSASNGRSAVLKACSNKEGLKSASIDGERRCTSKASLNGHELGSASIGRSAVLKACSNKEGLNSASIVSERRCTSNGNLNGHELGSNSNGRLTVLKACSNKEGLNSASIDGKRSIGRFFFENAIDFSALKSPSFHSMMALHTSIPSIDDLKDWILEDELSDIDNYVKNIRLSWAQTGCSILLDGWTDQLGRSLINVFVDCPAGPIYHRSADVSPSNGPDALKLFLESVLEELGIQNVVQIVAHTSSESLDELGEELIEKYRSLFWTVSGTHCLSLILDKIGGSNPIKLTLEKAKTITQFIYSRFDVLKLLRKHINCHDLVRPSKIKSATPFLTLENFLTEKSNLEGMFTSSEWLGSHWASSDQGKMVTHLIGDSSFWDEVVTVVKASIPLVNAISLINGDGEPPVGFIYETMDQIKETISDEFGEKVSRYTQYWNTIDGIWNNVLHSPLHAAGYYLNPKLHFADDFYADKEVAGDFLITIVRMVDGQHVQDVVFKQVYLYGICHGDFELGIGRKDGLSPAAWWTRYGCHCPELQRVAVRTLSQTCNGVEAYGLRRDLAEKLLSDTGRNAVEQKKLLDLTYLSYNLKLKQSKVGPKFDIVADEIDPMDDWIVEESD